MTGKTLLRTHDAHRDDIGDLVTGRPLPGPGLDALDPFLFLNHHGPQVYPPGNRGLPFGPHPHRGFETVTFIVDGELAHRDSAGHESVIEAGGVQWMTAGRGIVHEEVSPETFRRRGGPLEILQLWVNLPARLKMTAPRYVGLQRDAIPRVATPDGRGQVSVIAGAFGGTTGPVSPLAGVFMSTVTLAAGATLALDGLSGHAVFLYVVRGRTAIEGGEAHARQLAEISLEGDTLTIDAREDSLLLLGHARPFGEPIVAHGPFVMNTRDEIVAAVRDYQAGRFADLPV
jgi:redox-sensitive bicupin YhaK (pirin superfamily)